MKSRRFLPNKVRTGFAFRPIATRPTSFVVCRFSVAEIFTEDGMEGLEDIEGVGPSIARSIRDILLHGRLAMLDRLRGESDPVVVLASVPGVGRTLARRLHDELGIETLEELEVAARDDGRLEKFPSIGPKRLTGIRDSLAQRLGRIRRQTTAPPHSREPSIAELLDVDREYREKAAAGELKKIAPRRFNPTSEKWLPVLHTARHGRHYTALYSNTAHAHDLGKSRDWVVLFCDNGDTEHRFTVITSELAACKVSASLPAAKMSAKHITIAPPPRFVRRFYENVS